MKALLPTLVSMYCFLMSTLCPIEHLFPGLVKMGVKNFGQQGVKNNSTV